MRFKHAYIAFILGAVFTVAVLFVVTSLVQTNRYNRAVAELENTPQTNGFVLDPSSTLFRSPITKIVADDTAEGLSGLLLSPSGRYLVFESLHGPNADSATSQQRAYVADLMHGTKKEILGRVVWPWMDDNILLTTEPGMLHLFDMHSADSPLESFPIVGQVLSATPSPDKQTLAITTSSGVTLADRPTGTQRSLISQPDNAAMAWFSDNQRILGYQPSGEVIGEAETLKELVIWNLDTRVADPLIVDGLPGAIREIGWLVPDRLALVSTGFDDGLFFYSVNLETATATLLGEASELWYEGVDYGRVASRLGLLTPSFITTRDYSQAVVNWVALSTDIYRNNPTILDATSALYRSGPRQDNPSLTTYDVTRLSLLSGIEEKIFRSEEPLLDLVATRDTTGVYWVGMTAERLLVRKIPNE